MGELFWQIAVFWMVWSERTNSDQSSDLSIIESHWPKIGMTYFLNMKMELIFFFLTIPE